MPGPDIRRANALNMPWARDRKRSPPDACEAGAAGASDRGAEVVAGVLRSDRARAEESQPWRPPRPVEALRRRSRSWMCTGMEAVRSARRCSSAFTWHSVSSRAPCERRQRAWRADSAPRFARVSHSHAPLPRPDAVSPLAMPTLQQEWIHLLPRLAVQLLSPAQSKHGHSPWSPEAHDREAHIQPEPAPAARPDAAATPPARGPGHARRLRCPEGSSASRHPQWLEQPACLGCGVCATRTPCEPVLGGCLSKHLQCTTAV